MKKLLCVLLLILPGSTAIAEDIKVWDLPQDLDDKNTTVSFEVGTTWHVVYGKVSGVTGKVQLNDQTKPMSVASEIHFPVKSFNTGWDKRDESLYEHMKAEKYPEVVLKTSSIVGSCSPEVVAKEPCEAKLRGTLTIVDVTKPVDVNVVISKKGEKFEISGDYSFKWAEYNVDDPSIIVAKVDPTVKVLYLVTLPAVNLK